MTTAVALPMPSGAIHIAGAPGRRSSTGKLWQTILRTGADAAAVRQEFAEALFGQLEGERATVVEWQVYPFQVEAIGGGILIYGRFAVTARAQ